MPTFFEIINLSAGWLCIFSLFAPATIYPWIFNRYIIPDIEKQIGGKIYYPKSLLSGWNLSPKYMMPAVQVSFYIVLKYILSKILRCSSDQIQISKMYPLQTENYRIEDASKFTIIMSFVYWLSITWLIVGGTLMYFKIIH